MRSIYQKLPNLFMSLLLLEIILWKVSGPNKWLDKIVKRFYVSPKINNLGYEESFRLIWYGKFAQ